MTKVDLTPNTVKVGDGATIIHWSDRTACTVIEVKKGSVVIQEDKATLKGDWKPEWNGMHCTNQHEQDYDYEKNVNGLIHEVYWSKKYNQFGQPSGTHITGGRFEFYDYNF